MNATMPELVDGVVIQIPATKRELMKAMILSGEDAIVFECRLRFNELPDLIRRYGVRGIDMANEAQEQIVADRAAAISRLYADARDLGAKHSI